MIRRKRRGQKGFTLVEVAIASGIAVGMSLTCAYVLRTEARGWQSSESEISDSFELRRGLSSMARELTKSSGSQLEVLINGAWTAMPANGNPYTALQFRVPEDSADANATVLDAAGNVEWSANPIIYDTALMAGGSTALVRTQTGAAVTPLTLAYSVTAVTFTRPVPPDDSVVIISLTVRRGAAYGNQASTLSTRVRLRN